MKVGTPALLWIGAVFAASMLLEAREGVSSPGAVFSGRLEGMLAEMQDTGYQHTTKIDEDARSYRCDCSGLVGYVLRNDFPKAYEAVTGEEAGWRARPLSVTYYETFIRAGEARVPGWERVRRMIDARPGDILAWRKDEVVRGESTGHTLMIAGTPELESDGRVKVRVIDSTRRIHADDTRAEGTNGVGAGTMWFVVNNAGEPVGFYVDDGDQRGKSTLIAIGRLTNPDEKKDVSTGGAESGTDKDFIGLAKADAAALAKERKLAWRVVEEDGEQFPVTADYRLDRVNFTVVKGKVTKVRRG